MGRGSDDSNVLYGKTARRSSKTPSPVELEDKDLSKYITEQIKSGRVDAQLSTITRAIKNRKSDMLNEFAIGDRVYLPASSGMRPKYLHDIELKVVGTRGAELKLEVVNLEDLPKNSKRYRNGIHCPANVLRRF